MIDPLYQAVFGELSKEMPSKAIIRFVDMVREAFKPCAVILVHHTKKAVYAEGKRVQEADPYYGSQWLKAYVDTSYHLAPGTGKYAGAQVELACKKSRGEDVVKQLFLHYDPETDTVSTDAPVEQQSGYERVLRYLQKVKGEHRSTNFFEVRDACQLSTRQLRYVQTALLTGGVVRCGKYHNHMKIWEVL